MSFNPGTNIKIVGGEFTNIKGNYRLIDHSRHETNIDSNNMYDNTLTDSFNNNSKQFSGQNSRTRSAHDYGKDEEMQWAPSTPTDDRRREDYTGLPPPQSQFMPRQISSSGGGGHIANRDSLNMRNNQISDSFNDYSETHYVGRAPPIDQRRRVRPQNLQSSSELFGSGQFNGSEQTPNLPQYMENSLRPHIQHINQNMRQTFSKGRGQTQFLSEKNVVPNMPGDNDDDESDDADSSSRDIRAKDAMSTKMADLSIHDPIPSLTSRDNYRPQIATSLSPDPAFSRTNFQEPTMQMDRPMNRSDLGLYNNAYSHHSYSNPSFSPHITEPAMVNYLAQPTVAHQNEIHGNNDLNKSPPASTSSRGPIFRTINGDLTRYDTSVHQTNISSFNAERNTIKNSFNDNSLVDSSGKRKKGTIKQGVSECK